jgi:hypothetical protein
LISYGTPKAKAVSYGILDADLMKARGANRIRYPGSPSCKLWMLTLARFDPRWGKANALSIPPGEYVRKNETQRNRRKAAQAVDHVV